MASGNLLYDAGNPNLVLNDNVKVMGQSRSWDGILGGGYI